MSIVGQYGAVFSQGFDEPEQDAADEGWADAEVDRAPICPVCGVTALPAETATAGELTFVCENPDCEAFGELV